MSGLAQTVAWLVAVVGALALLLVLLAWRFQERLVWQPPRAPHPEPRASTAVRRVTYAAEDGQPLALMDARAVTALRTGAVAAVAAQELAREDAATVGIVGCGLHGSWAARCLAAAEWERGVCFDPDPDRAGELAGELGWEAGAREDALSCDVVTCVTPGFEPVGSGRVRLKLPPKRPSTVQVLGNGPEAAPAVLAVLTEIGVLSS